MDDVSDESDTDANTVDGFTRDEVVALIRAVYDGPEAQLLAADALLAAVRLAVKHNTGLDAVLDFRNALAEYRVARRGETVAELLQLFDGDTAATIGAVTGFGPPPPGGSREDQLIRRAIAQGAALPVHEKTIRRDLRTVAADNVVPARKHIIKRTNP